MRQSPPVWLWLLLFCGAASIGTIRFLLFKDIRPAVSGELMLVPAASIPTQQSIRIDADNFPKAHLLIEQRALQNEPFYLLLSRDLSADQRGQLLQELELSRPPELLGYTVQTP